MTAIFKRELKSYLTSMVGYLFIFFVLVLTGIYFSAYQLSGGYSKFETTLSALTFVFLNRCADPFHACTCRRAQAENGSASSDRTGICMGYSLLENILHW